MKQFINDVRDSLTASADSLNETADTLNQTADYIGKGMNIAEYWLDPQKRMEAKKEVQRWEKKTKNMVRLYNILWVVMIGVTVYICFKII
ncbi:hypothetical protein [Allofournierella massiliensis]|uniref:hypothetical protein n=1 Tax=Allofournierella massiliensis TaxID=1650663 RepID=UPI0024B19FB4|nr:hypothetical protein [Fournierella massiliensis]